MLIDFKVANFRSIAEPLTFSMQGSKASKASIETGSNAVPYLLRAAAIFGANGSGKTNLLMAADVLQRLLSGEITARPDPDEGLGRYYEPFVFDRNLRTQPTEFDIVFLAEVGDGTSAIFNYQLSYNADRICEERLFSRTTKPRARDRELFTRKWNSESGQYDFTFGPSALGSKELWMSEANETLPLLTVAAKRRTPEFGSAYLWLRRNLRISRAHRYGWPPYLIRRTSRMILRQEISAVLVTQFLKLLDVRVDRIDVSEDAEEPNARSYARRSIEVNLFSASRSDGEASISLYVESDGTVKLYELASDWIWTLRTGGTLFVDELQNGLHPRALAALIQMFRDPTVNRRNAQLVITSHDVTVLRRLEREEIWFVEKASDGASTLSSLVEYNTRKDYAFDKQYLEGRYGGVPVIDDFQEFADALNESDQSKGTPLFDWAPET